MEEKKRLKDPIYGYIGIQTRYMNEIIDTDCFQRLRRIIQTSYSPLYSSAVHNRFVHSLGVFHLGEMAIEQLEAEIKKKKIIKKFACLIKKYKEIFLIACLLHDVGHAPFSHTGEVFYLDENSSNEAIHEMLKDVVKSDSFTRDLPGGKYGSAAPHEIMSAIVGLKRFPEFFNGEEEREFFARCITGYRYSEKNEEKEILNCFVQILNSDVIDVDKLDYLIRDAYTTGFDTVKIDYERILKALTIVKTESGYELAYYKKAISVLENVVYAHDSERKWIQNHPIVIYESYLLTHIIRHICEKVKESKNKLFCLESLSYEGMDITDNIRVRLLSDDDIVFLMKNIFPNEMSEEYFKRIDRRHPLWKSEAEYKAFIIGKVKGGEVLDEFENAMSATAKYITGQSDSWTINDELAEKIKNDISELEKDDILDDQTKRVQLADKKRILKLITVLIGWAKKERIACDFVIIKANQFVSGFGKPNFTNMLITFPIGKDAEKTDKAGEIVTSLNAKEGNRKEFYYLFYKRKKEKGRDLSIKDLCEELMKTFM